MRRKILVSALALILLAPVLINILGWNLYIFTDFGEKDLVLASSVGVAHLAWSESIGDPETKEEKELEFDYLGTSDTIRTFIETGAVHIFAERRFDPMRPLGFGITNDESPFYYKAFEFPWILLPLATLLGFRKKRAEPDVAHNGVKPSPLSKRPHEI